MLNDEDYRKNAAVALRYWADRLEGGVVHSYNLQSFVEYQGSVYPVEIKLSQEALDAVR